MELWKSMYEVYPGYEISSNGNIRNFKTNKVLKTRKKNDGFAIVLLRDKNNLKKWVVLQDLMSQYFTLDEILEYV